jgi:hypothetical protein
VLDGPLVKGHGRRIEGKTMVENGRIVPIDYTRVVDLASNGNSLRTIAEELGIRWGTFLRRRKEDEELEAAIQTGRGREESALAGRLYRIAMEGSDRDASRAIMFLLKCRSGWREGEEVDRRGAVSVGVSITLPAALSIEDYQRLISGHPKALEADAVDAEAVEEVSDAD